MIGHPASEEVIIDHQVNNTHSKKKLLIRFVAILSILRGSIVR